MVDFSFRAITAAVAGSVLAVTSSAQVQSRTAAHQSTVQERKNISVVHGFWREVHQEFHGEAALKYLAPAYVEHNNGGVNGSARMAQVFGHPPPMMRQMKTISQTVYARGPFVLLHQHRLVPDPAHPGKTTDMDMIEMMRVYDGLLQEHWMYFPAGNTPRNQPQTGEEDQHIAVVKAFWHDVWEGHDGNAVSKYVAAGFIEHGAGEANGPQAVVQRLGHPPRAGAPHESVLSQTVYARGPFVLLHQQRQVSDSSQSGRTRSVDVIEMFQVYDGQLQQHWTFYPVDSGSLAFWGEGE
jgi:predicted SnoaL-like aldol condensation-catalyzing enzyme